MTLLHPISPPTRQRLRQECQHIVDNKEAEEVEHLERSIHQEIQAAQTQTVNQEMQQSADTHHRPAI